MLGPVLSAHGLISLGGSAAKNLSELTLDSIEETDPAKVVKCMECNYDNAPRVQIKVRGKTRSIPLVIRRDDYIEMDQPIDLQGE